MNLVILLATSVASLGLATLRSLLVRYFPYLPTEFDSTSTPTDYYDFIVVGAGCGGSVVASRLSETSARVLLLEAGASAPPESLTHISRFFSYFTNSNSFWRYEIKPQNDAYLGLINNTQRIQHGKVMGGSSTINAMIYTRGNKMDFDSWARLGNTGWDYDSILPYFKKSENLQAHSSVEEKYHGRNGPLNVCKTEADSDLINQFLMAGRQLGYKTIDPNEAYNLGFYSAHKTMRNGVRASASESFLGPVVNRPNLQIRTNALVTRVLFNKKKRAIGVQYVIDGKRRAVLARKEVILSAGAVRSSQLLLLSGVGPREHLEEMRIPVVAHVPGVGRNLHDHPTVFLPLIAKPGALSSILDSITIGALAEFTKNASGPLSVAPGEGWALMNVGGGDIHPSWPDVLTAISPNSLSSAGAEITADQVGYRPEIFEDVYGNLDGSTSFDMMWQLARPKSRGSITLKSTNPADNPIIDVNMFDHPDDIKLFVKAIRKGFDIARTPAFRDVLGVRVPDNTLTQCRSHGRDTDAYWECYLRHMVLSGSHLTSSVMMAPPRNPMGVVSPRLSVRGVTGLRVVDASIMPHNIGGNPMATTYMIGERGADFIREDWGYFTEFIA